jgi:hypothetical protein
MDGGVNLGCGNGVWIDVMVKLRGNDCVVAEFRKRDSELTPHSELFPSYTLNKIPDSSGHNGGLQASQKYESTRTVLAKTHSVKSFLPCCGTSHQYYRWQNICHTE